MKAFFQVKTGHRFFPKQFLSQKLQEAPGGCWITLTAKGPQGSDLMALGYKYNSKRVLFFVGTRDAGSTKAGKPYEMKFTDSFNNICTRDVPRPAVVSQFFDDSNVIDSHNQDKFYSSIKHFII